jgi:putative acetyltransferase
MQSDPFTIIAYREAFRQQVLLVWEKAVRATHHFLTPGDFTEIKAIVQTIDFTALPVFCITEKDRIIGFIGVADKKIEMLFIDPDYFGRGIGKSLVEFAINRMGAYKVDVNEQNTRAVNFYKGLGFSVYEKTETDDQDKNYPLLRMSRLHNSAGM